jgi:hypothetical protein
MPTRNDRAGVTRFIRSHWLKAACYDSLRKWYHSPSFDLDRLTATDVRLCLRPTSTG